MDSSKQKELEKRAREEAVFINHEKDEHQRLSEKASDEANQTTRTLSGQLIVISGAILTFSAAILSNGTLIDNLSLPWKLVLICSWGAFALSALVGLWQIRSDYGFFVSWADYNLSVAKELVTGKYISTNAQEAKDKFKKPSNSSKSYAITIQGILVVLGLIAFAVVLSYAVVIKQPTTKPIKTITYITNKR